jgi:hypothetical protein
MAMIQRIARPRDIVLVERDRGMCSQEEIETHDVRVRNSYSNWGDWRGRRDRRHDDSDSDSDCDDECDDERRRERRVFRGGRIGTINLISTGPITPPTITSQLGGIRDRILNVNKTAPGTLAVTFKNEIVAAQASLTSSTFPPNYPNPIVTFATLTFSDELGIDNVGAQYQISLIMFFKRDRCREGRRGRDRHDW